MVFEVGACGYAAIAGGGYQVKWPSHRDRNL